MKITKRITPNQNDRRDRNGTYKPDIIVCHITDGSYAGAVGWHCNPASGVSSHSIISRRGERTDIVPLEKMAWCNGTTTNGDHRDYRKATAKIVKSRPANANLYSVSIECEGYYKQTRGALTDVQLNALVDTILDYRTKIKQKYGILIPLDRDHIIGHYEVNPISRPSCPGEKFPWDELMKRLKLKDKPISTDNNNPKKLYRVQVGAFSNKSYAEAMMKELNASPLFKQKGYKAFIKEEDD